MKDIRLANRIVCVSQPPVKIEQKSFENHVIEVPTLAF